VVNRELGVAREARALALQKDGRIVVGGRAYATGASSYHNFALQRFKTNGSVDSSFGSGPGVITFFAGPLPPPTDNDEVRGIAIQPDGKIVAAGWMDDNVNISFALARYLA